MKLKDIKDACKKCRARCCKMGGPDFTEKEMKKVLKLNPKLKDRFVRLNKNHYELKVKRGICPFLRKDYSCSIHKARPLMCKCWPVYLEFIKGRKSFLIIQCPLTPYLTKEQIQTMKKQASKLPKEFVEGKETKFSKSEVKLVMKRFNKFKKKKLK